MKIQVAIFFSAVLSGLSCAANAQDNTVVSASGEAYKGNYAIDTGLPAVPAFEVIGFKSDGVIGTPLGADWYFDVAPDGDAGASIALNFKPYWVFSGTTRAAYQDDSAPDGRYKVTPFGILARTQVSLASNHDEEGRPQVGIGLQTSLLGNSDPRLNIPYTTCLDGIPAPQFEVGVVPPSRYPELREAVRSALAASSYRSETGRVIHALNDVLAKYPDGERDVILSQDLARAITTVPSPDLQAIFLTATANLAPPPVFEAQDDEKEKCVSIFKKDKARQDWYVGIGEAYASPDTSYSNFKSQGASAWMGYQRKLNDKGNFTLFYRMLPGQTIEYAKDQEAEARVGIYALKLDYQTPKWTAEFTLSQNDRNYRDPALEDVSFQRYSVSFSHKVTEKIWVVFEQGEVSEDLYNDGSYSLVSLRYVGE
ncbi:hypothetical protein ABAC460_15830 [Asticcacaulis sp. AC460]|uniref:hypothetical protein n=1 Tax=Asticcacaulis sp. AC460 TaxID=1282360 RepID=UPI0003C3B9A1|nr:hypothetical protein [Asticcacaulis sp. AC460]ESQ88500.1 hypothetical protein ABAC460_15830 [Asticcacaulis sp. AC460]